ncbi:hypothetical protein BDR05DRAFT_1005870 [Suillus weaverae]|nr:hypothetical protein BDR05DRAFT_1005870 [Suillus weaverae]
MSSPSAAAVRDALSTSVHKYQANSSPWKAKFKNRHLERSQRKAELINTILELTLQHRLPKPSC